MVDSLYAPAGIRPGSGLAGRGANRRHLALRQSLARTKTGKNGARGTANSGKRRRRLITATRARFGCSTDRDFKCEGGICLLVFREYDNFVVAGFRQRGFRWVHIGTNDTYI